MKKRILLPILVVMLPLAAEAQGKTFLEKFVPIYNRANEEKIELTRMSSRDILGSVNQEKGDVTRMTEMQPGDHQPIEFLENVREIVIAGGSGLSAVSDERYQSDLNRLMSNYEELMMVNTGKYGVKMLARFNKDKITEMVMWLDIPFNPLQSLASSHISSDPSKALLLSMMDLSMEAIVGFTFHKGITLEEFVAPFRDNETESERTIEQEQADLFDNLLEKLGIGFDFEDSFTLGKWLDKDTPARNWEIKKTGQKYGLYDPTGKEILPAEYDEIKHFHGFFRDTDAYAMYIQGFSLTQGGKKGYADLEGSIIFAPEYDDLKHFELERSRYMRLYKDGKQGLGEELTGKWIVPIEYDDLIWRGDYIELRKGSRKDKIGWDREKQETTGEIIQGE